MSRLRYALRWTNLRLCLLFCLFYCILYMGYIYEYTFNICFKVQKCQMSPVGLWFKRTTRTFNICGTVKLPCIMREVYELASSVCICSHLNLTQPTNLFVNFLVEASIEVTFFDKCLISFNNIVTTSPYRR